MNKRPQYEYDIHTASKPYQIAFCLSNICVTRTKRHVIYFYGSDIMLLDLCTQIDKNNHNNMPRVSNAKF